MEAFEVGFNWAGFRDGSLSSRPTALVVEDEANIRELVSCLGLEDVDSVEASDGPAGSISHARAGSTSSPT
jgi:hypothetical protein